MERHPRTGLLGDRFTESTRGRIVTLLRRGPWTVEELASELQLTDNAVRPHLLGLERDGVIRQAGVRRSATAGKPAAVYELHADAEPQLSRAYAPVLSALVEVLAEELPARQARKLLRATGRRLAAAVGIRGSGDLGARARVAADVLRSLGGVVEVEDRRGLAMLRGAACPVASSARKGPHICAAVESLVSEVSGAAVKECCDRSDSPRCCFELRNRAV